MDDQIVIHSYFITALWIKKGLSVFFEAPAEKSDNFMIIELTLFPGRTREQKKAAIEIITAKLVEALSIAPEDVFINIAEPPLENWGMAGKQKG